MPVNPGQDAVQILNLRRQGFRFSGSPYIDAAKLFDAGLMPSYEEAVRLSRASGEYLAQPKSAMGSAALEPLRFAGEALMTLQKPVQAMTAGIHRGAGFGEILGEMAKAPFTSRRSFAESGLGPKSALIADIVADPLWAVGLGASLKAGKAGRAMELLEGAKLDVHMGKVFSVKTGQQVTSMREALSRPIRFAGKKEAGDWQKTVRGARSTVGKAWMRANPGKKMPNIDQLVAGNMENAAKASDLIRSGVSGLASVGIGTRRVVPMKRAQAAVARMLESSPVAAKLGMKKLFELDRNMKFFRTLKSARTAQASVQNLMVDVMRDIEEMTKKLGLDFKPGDAEWDDLMQAMEGTGILQHGGAESWGRATEKIDEMQDIHTDLKKALSLREDVKAMMKTPDLPGKGLSKAAREAELTAGANEMLRDLNVFKRVGDDGVNYIQIGPADNFNLDRFKDFSKITRETHLGKALSETGDPHSAMLRVRDEVQGEIETMALQVFGIKEGSAKHQFMKYLDKQFQDMGAAEILAGLRDPASMKKGYVPRTANPFSQRLLQDRWEKFEQAIEHPTAKRVGGGAGPLGTWEKSRMPRTFENMTRMEIEDAFTRGKLTATGYQFKKDVMLGRDVRLGLDLQGKNGVWASFMSKFTDNKLVADLSKVDPEICRFFVSDPVVMMTLRRAEFSRAMNANDFVSHALKVFHVNKITKLPDEAMGQFTARIAKELGETYGGAHPYVTVMKKTELPEEYIKHLHELDLTDVKGFYFVDQNAVKAMNERLVFPTNVKGWVDRAQDQTSIAKSGFKMLPTAKGKNVPREFGDVMTSLPVPSKAKRQEVIAYVMDKDIRDALLKADKRMTDVGELQRFMGTLTDLTRLWKAWALFPRSAYHFRNFVSNSWLMYQAGMMPHEIPIYYMKAMKLNLSSRGAKFGLDIGDVGARGTVKKITARGDLDTVVAKNSLMGEITGGQALEELYRSGVKTSTHFGVEMTEGVVREAWKARGPQTLTKHISPVNIDNAPLKLGRAVGQRVEDLSRTGLYLWALDKGESFSSAANTTIRHLFNYNDLRPLERKFRDVAVPFYTWMRYNIPLQLRKLMEHPSKTTAPLRAALSMDTQLGITKDLEPEWLAGELGFPMRRKLDEKGRRVVEYGFMGSYFPVGDLARFGAAATALVMSGFKPLAEAVDVLPEQVQKDLKVWEDKGTGGPLRAFKYLIPQLTPLAVNPIEIAAGMSFFRMRKIDRGTGDLVKLHYLGGAQVTKDFAHAMNAMPLLSEINKLMTSEDYRGIDIPLDERITKIVTGMPGLHKGEFGGRTEVDVMYSRRRMINKMKAEQGRAKYSLRQQRRAGTITPEQRDSIMARLKLIRGRAREIKRTVR